jgi:hypothetical protein
MEREEGGRRREGRRDGEGRPRRRGSSSSGGAVSGRGRGGLCLRQVPYLQLTTSEMHTSYVVGKNEGLYVQGRAI